MKLSILNNANSYLFTLLDSFTCAYTCSFAVPRTQTTTFDYNNCGQITINIKIYLQSYSCNLQYFIKTRGGDASMTSSFRMSHRSASYKNAVCQQMCRRSVWRHILLTPLPVKLKFTEQEKRRK